MDLRNLIADLRNLIGVRLVDVLDIFIVSYFLYLLLSWLYRTATRAAAFGAIALGLLYIFARSMGMVLTTAVFHAGALVCLVALVVVFQEDVRRGLQRLPLRSGAILRRVSRDPDRRQEVIRLLVDVTMRLAESKTGALLVLVGNEPLAAHLSSGIPVSGDLNKELLLSIFDTGSPGHDGAVVIDRGNLWQFAAHLPLATRPLAPDTGGTRHRAAVGLAERCDALVIVVSEERGVISIAEGGEIREISGEGEMRQRLERFFNSRFPIASTSVWRLLTANLRLKFLSLAVSFAAWGILVAGPSTIHRTYTVPVEYRDLPAGLVIAANSRDEATVTLGGPAIAFRNLDPTELRFTADVSDVDPGVNYIPLLEADLRRPPRLELESVAPPTILLIVEEEGAPAGAAVDGT